MAYAKAYVFFLLVATARVWTMPELLSSCLPRAELPQTKQAQEAVGV